MSGRGTAARTASPVVDRSPVPVFAEGRGPIGRATSHGWSPILKQMLALASVPPAFERPGTRVEVEWTVEGHRDRVRATVVELPFAVYHLAPAGACTWAELAEAICDCRRATGWGPRQVAGKTGRFSIVLENVPAPNNPKTAWLACYSALAALKEYGARARYGT